MAYQPVPGTGSGLQFLNYPFGDTTFTKVFVGGLAWETQSETLRRHFEQYGEILEAVVITDKHTGRSKGYGFVTFRDPESAKKACMDPNPVIDGRRANCNLASLGRSPPSLPHGRLRSATPNFGMTSMPRGAYAGSSNFNRPAPYSYQPGVVYPPFGYGGYGPEYVYPQGVYNPYVAQHYLQMYGMPGTVNTNIIPYGQTGHPLPSNHGYTSIQGYAPPVRHVLPYGGAYFSGVTTENIATIQAPYHTAMSDAQLLCIQKIE
ncbi:uncharacterized protein LOC127804608 isoform X2 [Diospyros lotus]|uniref:uncharacterized protein LOC127804608 isoform X2 n=1 Tax=Diospyros lotus TaxID=55363 RepID=UPI00225C0061|nr:uncharacterized protein LOC127804608 isoform X2 [Diospyros lotus]